MCDPLTIAGLALTAGSTVANYAAQSKVQAARNDAMAAERIRQTGLDRQATAINETSRGRYDNIEGQQQDKATKLGDYFAQQATAEPTTAEALPTSTSNVTVQEEANQRAKARSFTEQSGAALGNLRAFGDVLGGIGRQQARDAGEIGQIGGFKAGSSGVLGYELDDASHKGDGLKMFGDLLGGVGGVATSAGLSGKGLFGIGAKGGSNIKTSGSALFSPAAGASARGNLRLGSLYGG